MTGRLEFNSVVKRVSKPRPSYRTLEHRLSTEQAANHMLYGANSHLSEDLKQQREVTCNLRNELKVVESKLAATEEALKASTELRELAVRRVTEALAIRDRAVKEKKHISGRFVFLSERYSELKETLEKKQQRITHLMKADDTHRKARTRLVKERDDARKEAWNMIQEFKSLVSKWGNA